MKVLELLRPRWSSVPSAGRGVCKQAQRRFLYGVEKTYSTHVTDKKIQQNQVKDKHEGDKNIPRPREATSVAIRIGALPLRNSAGIKTNQN